MPNRWRFSNKNTETQPTDRAVKRITISIAKRRVQKPATLPSMPAQFIELKGEQNLECSFPVNCPVYVCDDGKNAPASILSKGLVTGVFVQMIVHRSLELFYRVDLSENEYANSKSALITESQIRYSNGCPVYVTLVGEGDTETKKEKLKGVVLGFYDVPKDRAAYTSHSHLYSVQLLEKKEENLTQIVHEVCTSQIKFRSSERDEGEADEDDASAMNGVDSVLETSLGTSLEETHDTAEHATSIAASEVSRNTKEAITGRVVKVEFDLDENDKTEKRSNPLHELNKYDDPTEDTEGYEAVMDSTNEKKRKACGVSADVASPSKRLNVDSTEQEPEQRIDSHVEHNRCVINIDTDANDKELSQNEANEKSEETRTGTGPTVNEVDKSVMERKKNTDADNRQRLDYNQANTSGHNEANVLETEPQDGEVPVCAITPSASEESKKAYVDNKLFVDKKENNAEKTKKVGMEQKRRKSNSTTNPFIPRKTRKKPLIRTNSQETIVENEPCTALVEKVVEKKTCSSSEEKVFDKKSDIYSQKKVLDLQPHSATLEKVVKKTKKPCTNKIIDEETPTASLEKVAEKNEKPCAKKYVFKEKPIASDDEVIVVKVENVDHSKSQSLNLKIPKKRKSSTRRMVKVEHVESTKSANINSKVPKKRKSLSDFMNDVKPKEQKSRPRPSIKRDPDRIPAAPQKGRGPHGAYPAKGYLPQNQPTKFPFNSIIIIPAPSNLVGDAIIGKNECRHRALMKDSGCWISFRGTEHECRIEVHGNTSELVERGTELVKRTALSSLENKVDLNWVMNNMRENFRRRSINAINAINSPRGRAGGPPPERQPRGNQGGPHDPFHYKNGIRIILPENNYTEIYGLMIGPGGCHHKRLLHDTNSRRIVVTKGSQGPQIDVVAWCIPDTQWICNRILGYLGEALSTRLTNFQVVKIE